MLRMSGKFAGDRGRLDAASAIAIGNVGAFSKAHGVVAWCGLVPKQTLPLGIDSVGLHRRQIQRLIDQASRAFEVKVAIDVLLHYNR